ncbi:MAG: DUF4065 domain-containing protein [Clostridiales bacterium]|nr:DUF4065 domain-containing protein [Clostridiales bacterium]
MAMKNNHLIRKIQMECPLCDKVHEIEERTRVVNTIIKGENVNYIEKYYFCSYSNEDENEFVTGRMENDNLLNARNEYRRVHGLLTSDEIVAIRENYGLSQVDLAKLLGWGEATISRYESKAIQDEAYDNMLRIIKENPLMAYGFLVRNVNKFTEPKQSDIKKRIIDNMDSYGKENIKRQALESEYINYNEPSEENGNQILDIDKLESIVTYFAKHIGNLYKIKLMKMLWYTDSLNYKVNNHSMTGLVYRHADMGALPIGHYLIMDLENINVKEEDDYDNTRFHIFPKEGIDMSCITQEDKMILDRVINKFKDFNTKDIVEYMHDEIAYKETKDGDIIPFGLAKSITLSV